jgi:glycosyltransferase involved in cell wall biosynthesis
MGSTRKFLMIGYFGYESDQLDGQTIKTRSIYELLSQKYTVKYFDTESLKTNKFKILELIYLSVIHKTIFYVADINNLSYFFPFLFIVSNLFNNTINYITVGGWLYDFINEHNKLYTKFLKRINSILVETKYLKKNLEDEGFKNVEVIPNFRILPNNYEIKINRNNSDTLKIVFMARIMYEKGIYLVLDFYNQYLENRDQFKKGIVIDFYGPLINEDKAEFMKRVKALHGINYEGALEPSEIYDTLSKYDFLVLPTFFEAEGFPGTILDAYHSGLPVITTNWKQIPEFVDNGQSGFLIDYDLEQLFNKVKALCNNEDLLLKMKKYAYQKSNAYSDVKALKILEETLS